MTPTPDYSLCPVCGSKATEIFVGLDDGYMCRLSGGCRIAFERLSLRAWIAIHDLKSQAFQQGYETCCEEHVNTKPKQEAAE